MSVTDAPAGHAGQWLSPIPCDGQAAAARRVAEQDRAQLAPRSRSWPAPIPACLTRATRRRSTSTSPTPRRPTLAEDVAKELFGDRGKILVRFGRLPKRALPFRTATPFPKMSAQLRGAQRHRAQDRDPVRRAAIHLPSASTRTPASPTPGTATHAAGHAARRARRGHRGGHAGLPRARRRAAGGGARLEAQSTPTVTAPSSTRPARSTSTRASRPCASAAPATAIHPTQLPVTASLLRGGRGLRRDRHAPCSRPPRRRSPATRARPGGTGRRS